MFCTECGKSNPDGAKFCAFCGTRLFAPESVPQEKNDDLAEALQRTSTKVAALKGVKPIPALTEDEPEKSVPKEEPAPIKAPEPSPLTNFEPATKLPPVRQYESSIKPAGRTLKPVLSNPAQPERTEPATAAKPVIAPSPVPTPKPKAPGRTVFIEKPFPAQTAEAEWDGEEKKPGTFRSLVNKLQKITEAKNDDGQPEDLWKDNPADKKALDDDLFDDIDDDDDDDDDTEKPSAFRCLIGRLNQKQVVLTANGTEEIPGRKPVVTRSRRNTLIPKRIDRPIDDDDDDDYDEDDRPVKRQKKAKNSSLFMAAPPKKRREEPDDDLDDGYVNRRVHTIVFGVAFTAVLMVCIWLFATSSGSIFLAGFNLSGNANAYRSLGDTALANNQVKRAAEAYYMALSLDPDDYSTALLVGITQQQIANYETAEKAYYKAITLSPNSAEAYRYIIKLYQIEGDLEKAEYFRQLAIANTGLTDY